MWAEHSIESVTVMVPQAAAEQGRLVRFSLPLKRGELREGDETVLIAPGGDRLFLQTRPLARWDDGSIRWVECHALAAEGGVHRVETGGAVALPADPVRTSERDAGIVLGNGSVEVALSAEGDSPVSRVLHRGCRVSADRLAFQCRVTDAAGTCYTAAHVDARSVRWLWRGPVCAAAEVSGRLLSAGGLHALNYRLRVKVFAGLPVLHMSLWLVHDVPEKPLLELEEASCSMSWLLPDRPVRYLHQNRYSLLSVPRDVATTRRVELRGAGEEDIQIRVHNPECLADTTDYPYFMGLPLNESEPYLGLSLVHGWVACAVEDFLEKCPKGLVGEDDALTLELWPAWAGVCQWRQGRSRAMEWRLAFGDEGEPTLARARQLASAATDMPPVRVDPDRYAESAEFHADSVVRRDRAGVRRLDRQLTRLMNLETPIGMWDLGDTYEHGYSRTYAAIGRLRSRDTSVPARFRAGSRIVLDWSNPNQFEPVWSNNEYDVIICMAREFMRGGGTPALWQHLKWFARHAVEVDFVHYSDCPLQHHGSPAHSASHDQASAYPSHLWSEGLLAYYCLSGDDDALAVAVQTGDYIIDYFRGDEDRRRKVWKFTRELGWALLHVATLADLTREPRFSELSRELADFFVTHELDEPLLRGMVQYAFAYASLVLGVEATLRVDAKPAYRDWIVRLADGAGAVIDDELHGAASLMNLNYLVPAYEITGHTRYLETGRKMLEVYVDGKSWYDPMIGTKASAMTFRGLSRFVHHAHNEGLLDSFEYRYAT